MASYFIGIVLYNANRFLTVRNNKAISRRRGKNRNFGIKVGPHVNAFIKAPNLNKEAISKHFNSFFRDTYCFSIHRDKGVSFSGNTRQK